MPLLDLRGVPLLFATGGGRVQTVRFLNDMMKVAAGGLTGGWFVLCWFASGAETARHTHSEDGNMNATVETVRTVTDLALFDAIRAAHDETGAPGRVIVITRDARGSKSGKYLAQLQYGRRAYLWQLSSDRSSVTVHCAWSVCGERHLKSATVAVA